MTGLFFARRGLRWNKPWKRKIRPIQNKKPGARPGFVVDAR
jgi:hypothetical protein